MNDDKKPYTPTDDEAEAIDRAGLVAAWHELQPLKDDDLPIPEKVLACLRAFKAARAGAYGARETLEEAHPEANFVSYFPEPTDIVCSAVMGLDLVDGPDEICVRPVLGVRLSALFQAAKVLEAMSTVHSVFDDDDGIFGTYLADEATMLAEASILGRPEGA